MGNAEMDEHILAICDGRWRKVAFIVSRAAESANLQDKAWGYDAVAKRVRALVRKNRLEAVGNLWSWRYSEVRTPPGTEQD